MQQSREPDVAGGAFSNSPYPFNPSHPDSARCSVSKSNRSLLYSKTLGKSKCSGKPHVETLPWTCPQGLRPPQGPWEGSTMEIESPPLPRRAGEGAPRVRPYSWRGALGCRGASQRSAPRPGGHAAAKTGGGLPKVTQGRCNKSKTRSQVSHPAAGHFCMLVSQTQLQSPALRAARETDH